MQLCSFLLSYTDNPEDMHTQMNKQMFAHAKLTAWVCSK